MVSDLVERIRTEEPDAGVPHVRICGEGAGQPVPLPGVLHARFSWYLNVSAFYRFWVNHKIWDSP